MHPAAPASCRPSSPQRIHSRVPMGARDVAPRLSSTLLSLPPPKLAQRAALLACIAPAGAITRVGCPWGAHSRSAGCSSGPTGGGGGGGGGEWYSSKLRICRVFPTSAGSLIDTGSLSNHTRHTYSLSPGRRVPAKTSGLQLLPALERAQLLRHLPLPWHPSQACLHQQQHRRCAATTPAASRSHHVTIPCRCHWQRHVQERQLVQLTVSGMLSPKAGKVDIIV